MENDAIVEKKITFSNVHDHLNKVCCLPPYFRAANERRTLQLGFVYESHAPDVCCSSPSLQEQNVNSPPTAT